MMSNHERTAPPTMDHDSPAPQMPRKADRNQLPAFNVKPQLSARREGLALVAGRKRALHPPTDAESSNACSILTGLAGTHHSHSSRVR